MKKLIPLLSAAGAVLLLLGGCAVRTEVLVPDVLPRLRDYRTIVYPVQRLSRSEYRVTVELLIDDEGNVRGAQLHSGTGTRALDDSILSAVGRWKFSPAELNGKPVSLKMSQEITIRFEPPLEYTLAEIVVPSIALADSLAGELERGARFDRLAREYSISKSAANGGLIGEVELKTFRPDIYTIVRRLTPGSHSGPVSIDHVYAIYKRIN